eukprot:TRINITY_DN37803_c0_g1_i1.p1 TRINITY_DN37803_c0_g1~~TRINITY_DN37803_c0_g1_i1.p1  ORF type:complete len:208 (+),score=68.23 TRINITY_DN37803_c0_g1_i1:92-625(+)
MTDLTSQPWVVGMTVQVSPERDAVERLCRSSWSGWSRKKEKAVGQRGVVLTIRKPDEDSVHGSLLELSFDDGERFWFPSKALVSPFGRGEEKTVYAATNDQRTPESSLRWRVIFAGRELKDHEVLWETGVGNTDTLQLLRGDGGYEPWGAIKQKASPSRPPRDSTELPTEGFFESFF